MDRIIGEQFLPKNKKERVETSANQTTAVKWHDVLPCGFGCMFLHSPCFILHTPFFTTQVVGVVGFSEKIFFQRSFSLCIGGIASMPLQLPLDIDRIESALRWSLLLSGPSYYIRISAVFLSFLDARDCCKFYLTCYCLYHDKPELNLF